MTKLTNSAQDYKSSDIFNTQITVSASNEKPIKVQALDASYEFDQSSLNYLFPEMHEQEFILSLSAVKGLESATMLQI